MSSVGIKLAALFVMLSMAGCAVGSYSKEWSATAGVDTLEKGNTADPDSEHIIIAGEVNRPGIYLPSKYHDNRVFSLITVAGGLKPFATSDRLFIITPGGGDDADALPQVIQTSLREAAVTQLAVKPGSILYVPSRSMNAAEVMRTFIVPAAIAASNFGNTAGYLLDVVRNDLPEGGSLSLTAIGAAGNSNNLNSNASLSQALNSNSLSNFNAQAQGQAQNQ